MVDGNKKPTMDFLYEAIHLMKEATKAVAPHSNIGYLKIVNETWRNMHLHPLHKAG